MSDPKAGLSTGSADSGFETAFLAGAIQRDYLGLVGDPADVLEFDFKGGGAEDTDARGCSSDQTPCCPAPKPKPKPKPKPAPKKKASWSDAP
jgi:hypothetical protein